MPVRARQILPNQYYHVYNRVSGNNILFPVKKNYLNCCQLLTKYAAQGKIGIVAFCLMPTHYHLLLIQRGNASISKYISNVFNCYVQAFNKQTGRKGPLFLSRFKNKSIDKQEYLLYLCRYIHLNPVKAGLVHHPAEWPYSDYKEWVGQNKPNSEQAILICDYFQGVENYEQFVMEYKIDKDIEGKLEKYYLDCK
ncbi:transposase [bacterium]|nr:transposase [bacterium]